MENPNPLLTRTKLLLVVLIILALFSAGFIGASLITRQQIFPINFFNSNKSITLPIDPKSFPVKSAGVLYLLHGVVQEFTPAPENGKDRYLLKLTDSQGTLLENTFYATEEGTTVVLLYHGEETRISMKEVKNGDAIQLNYYIDLKGKGGGQVTKIVIISAP